jgi:hypothetical protein
VTQAFAPPASPADATAPSPATIHPCARLVPLPADSVAMTLSMKRFPPPGVAEATPHVTVMAPRTYGVLLDTLLVRTVLVPASLLAIGERAWWPARPWGDAAAVAVRER